MGWWMPSGTLDPESCGVIFPYELQRFDSVFFFVLKIIRCYLWFGKTSKAAETYT